MNLLLDEDMPHAFRHELPGHDVRTASYMGWKSKVNGELLALARDEFDVLITLDQHLEEQQSLNQSDVGIVVLRPGSDDIEILKTLVPEILEKLPTVRRGQVIYIPPKE